MKRMMKKNETRMMMKTTMRTMKMKKNTMRKKKLMRTLQLLRLTLIVRASHLTVGILLAGLSLPVELI